MFIDRRQSLYIGHLGPVPLYLHWTFLILLWMCWPNDGMKQPALAVLIVMILIVGVVLHELGHAMAARTQGTFGVTITLWAFGGLCSSVGDRLPRRELIVLIAGPAVSFLLAFICYSALAYVKADHPEWLINSSGLPSWTLYALVFGYQINLKLGIFNSLPIFPLDGGQIVYNAAQLFIRERIARSICLFVGMCTAAAYLAWVWQQQGSVPPTTIILFGMLLYQAFTYLR